MREIMVLMLEDSIGDPRRRLEAVAASRSSGQYRATILRARSQAISPTALPILIRQVPASPSSKPYGDVRFRELIKGRQNGDAKLPLLFGRTHIRDLSAAIEFDDIDPAPNTNL